MTSLDKQVDKSLVEYQCEETMRTAMNLYRSYCERIQDWFPIVEMQENGICCIVFKGDHVDQEVIEEYLRTRPFTEEAYGVDTCTVDSAS